jgi:uncharacterized protein
MLAKEYEMISKRLIEVIIAQHHLRGRGSIHYIDHWARVLENGRRLAPVTGARIDVVELFAVFHDAGRVNDGNDAWHGARGARLAEQLHGVHFHLDEPGMALLTWACTEHTLGKLEADVTVQTCWDSDRLDLGRAGIHPIPQRLCTPEARNAEVIAWAHARSTSSHFPSEVLAEWGVDRA